MANVTCKFASYETQNSQTLSYLHLLFWHFYQKGSHCSLIYIYKKEEEEEEEEKKKKNSRYFSIHTCMYFKTYNGR